MVAHFKDVIELPYAFFLYKILAYFGVNFSNQDHVKIGDFMISMEVCNNNMGVEYNFKNTTIWYIDEGVNV